ncbi:MAG: fumarylacetoacetate hydrolase family protein [Proteobacteria bacterium]|nr:fumarylacetoacetate hydrolase family protein [Pseudomonadota bacterium]
MKLATYKYNNRLSIGAITDKGVLPASDKYHGMIHFLHAGQTALTEMNDCINTNPVMVPLEEVQLLAPIIKPDKFFGVSLNYADHIKETGLEQPEYPTFFNKQNSCVTGPGSPIHRPKVSEKLDYEGELGIVIGKRCRHVNREQAKNVIAGYTIVNDVSVRDWQMRSHTWTLGKSFDTHGPIGPWIVTTDEIGDPHQLAIKTWVNEDLRQDSNTKHLIFDCYYLIEYLSQVMTLEPGDIIATGTSSGVGVKMKPRGYMKPGDTVKIEIEKIGTLINPVIEEPETSKIY